MRKYEKYKDSGVEWIGEIPEHWEIQRLKYNALIILGKMLMSNPPKGEEFKYTLEKYLKSKNIGWLQVFNGSKDVDEMWFNDLEKKLYKLEVGDIVMNEGGDIGKVSLWPNSDFDCYIQNSVHRITSPKNVDIKYLAYFLYATSKRGYFWSIVSQISIAHLTKEKLSNTPTVIPSLPEQESIASYLDSKVGEIDNMIEKTEKKIKLYEELKKSIITRAVTKGLNPNAKMKDSGVEWIGEVPEHWNKCRLKFNCCLKGRIGWNGLRSDEFETDSYAYLVTGQDFKSSDIEWSKCYQINKNRYEEDPFIQLKNGDLLITKDGTIGKIAKVSNMDKSACLNSGIFVMKQKSKKNEFTQGFLYWLLCSDLFKAFNQYTTTGTTILHLYQNVFENMPLLIPSLPEQQSIASYLDSKTSTIDSQISIAHKRIDLLKELKSSLITNVVTGKIKVC